MLFIRGRFIDWDNSGNIPEKVLSSARLEAGKS
jgi:hypothetical protein